MDPKSNNESLDRLRQRLQAALSVNDSKSQACHELEMKLKQLQAERDQLAHENEKLLGQNAKIHNQIDSTRRSSGASNKESPQVVGRRLSINKSGSDEMSPDDVVHQQNKRLQNELRRLKEDLIKVEIEKEDYRLKSNLLQEDLDRTTMRNAELRDKAEQARRLQDELDEHKHISGKVISYEQMIENLVKKNNELKTELKNLEEKNLGHVQEIVKLESENEHFRSSLSEVAIYRRQLVEAQQKLGQETHRADKTEVELSRLAEKFAAAKRENEKLFETTNQLMLNNNNQSSQNEAAIDALGQQLLQSVELKADAQQQQQQQPSDVIDSMSTSVIELKERVARLEMENQLLVGKLQVKNNEQNKPMLAALLDEQTEQCKRLESDNRQARKRIMALEASLKDLGQGSTSGAGAPQQVASFAPLTSSDNVLALIKRVEELQRALNAKDQELREAETKYRKNIQKAREVMRALNINGGAGTVGPYMSSVSSLNSSNSLDEVSQLRQQLCEREERLVAMEREFYEFKRLKEVHERLILSAFHSLSTPMQWRNAEKRLEQSTLTSPPNTANSSFSNHFSPAKSGH